jgi:cytochrome b561
VVGTVARFGYRLRNAPPSLPADIGAFSRRFYLAYALFALAGLHALTALWHRFVLHDGVLARIWPSRRQLKH